MQATETFATGSTVRLATYNCMNLFAWAAEPQEPVNPAKPQREVRALAKTLDWLSADVVTLQEVGSQTALEDLNSLLREPFPHVALSTTNSDRGIHLGFMARAPFMLHTHCDQPLLDESGEPLTDLIEPAAASLAPMRLQRDIVFAEFGGAGGEALFVANVHLKSAGKRHWQTLSPLTVRTAECRVLAELLNRFEASHPESPIFVQGDFNDNPTSSAFAPLSGVRSGTLFDPLMRELVPANPRLSTYWPKRRTRIDRILLNSAARKLYVPGSIRLWGNKRAEVASDHFPLSIDLHSGPEPCDPTGVPE